MPETQAGLGLLAAILGLLTGSFLNVVILRLPRRLEHQWRQQCREMLETPAVDEKPPADLVFTPSHCPQCQAPIHWYHNIPLAGWLALRGRCAQCKAPISLQYPTVEALTGLLFLVVALHLGLSMAGIAAIILTAALIALSGIDIRVQLLPDVIVLPMLWIGLLLNTQNTFTDLQSAVLGAVIGYMILWLVYQTFRVLTGKEGMGYGDFKLLAMLGAWMGWQMVPLIIVLSSFVGAAVGLAMIVLRGRDRNIPIPFGPYLAAAGWIALLWGDRILATYLGMSGL